MKLALVTSFWRKALLGSALGALCLAARGAEPDAATHFEAKVRPILEQHCVSCHGLEKQKSDLRLDSGAGVFSGGSRGPAVVAGDPESSLLLQAVLRGGDIDMPPDGPLPPEDVETLRQWIADGAVWPDYDPAAVRKPGMDLEAARRHWAFQPVAHPGVPEVADTAWPKNAIDYFVLRQIEVAGLMPSPPAEKSALLRRATLDLTGLPPTPEALEAFIADDAPDAFARVVERLLASPQYGERWARHWLDVVRYTDSFDSRASTVTDPAEIWRYRDWVVRSFNEDLPYNDFLRLQIAGDVIPAADGSFNRDGLVATGVLAIGNWPQGDADKEKMVADIVDDQVDLVTRGFLGLTVSCARCHDHKFEPISTEDYYGLAGMFFSSSILPGPGAKTEGSPILHLPLASPEELAARAEREQRLNELRGQRDALLRDERAAFARQEATRTRDYVLASLSAAHAADPPLDAGTLDAWQVYLGRRPGTLDQAARDVNGLPGLHSRRGVKDMPSAVLNLTGKDQLYATISHPAGAIVLHPSPEQPALAAWHSPVDGAVRFSAQLNDADGVCGNGFTYRVTLHGSTGAQVLAEGDVDNGKAADLAPAEAFAVAAGDSIVITIDPRGDYACDSTAVYFRIEAEGGEAWAFPDEVREAFLEGASWADHAGRPGVWQLHDPNTAAPAIALLDPLRPLAEAATRGDDIAQPLQEFAAQVQQQLDAGAQGQDAALAAAWDALTGEQGPFWKADPPAPAGSARPELDAAVRALEENPLPALDLAVGIQEGAVPGTAYSGTFDVRVHRRGDYNNLGDVVPRRMPVVLAGDGQPPIAAGSGRLELAEWIAGRDNPLTARVMANRIWLHHFGEGIVRTAGDFGTRGDAPTHPELLDFLAATFMDSGWSMKALHRLIMNSAAYQQASRVDPERHERDPENRLFARMNRQRKEAEVLRDSLLAVSGQLDLSGGGPAYNDLLLPRRTLYLKTNRSDRTTFAMLFDAADPTSIIPKRTEATVAPQALFLMNHPFMQSTAAALAESLSADDNDLPALVNGLYLRLYARDAAPREVELAAAFLQENGYPESEALETYCQTLLCANEFVFYD